MCEKCLSEALIYNPDSFDALIQLSNLRILRKRDDEALMSLEKIYIFILDCLDKCNDQKLPTQDIILNLSKNFAELGQYIKAIKLLDLLIKLHDEDLEYWYLLAFNHYTIKNFKNAARCLKHFKKVSEKTSYKSDSVLELEDAAAELEATLENVRKSMKDGELRNNNIEESEENDEEESCMNSSNCDEMNID
jgi:tetratricopeptide (TPR) repeat protein